MKRHVPALDGLRGIAVLLVLAHNFDVVEGGGLARRAVGLLLDVGWVGVQLFFVLSGFLITGILLDTREAPRYWRSFLGRRALRIFPLYYGVLVAAFVVAPLLDRRLEGAEHQVWLWTYLVNWVGAPRTVPLFPHFWSLAIEEQFYFVWPLLVRKLPSRALAMTCGGIVVAALASRLAVRGTLGPHAAYTFTVCRADALALGALAALAMRSAKVVAWLAARRRTLRGWSAVGLIVTVVATRGAPRSGALTQAYGYTLFAAAFAWLVLDAALAAEGDVFARLLATPPLRAVGRYSYGMYVFHQPLHLLVGVPLLARVGAAPGIALGLLYFASASALTFACAAFSYHAYESRFLALKKRFSPS